MIFINYIFRLIYLVVSLCFQPICGVNNVKRSNRKAVTALSSLIREANAVHLSKCSYLRKRESMKVISNIMMKHILEQYK